MNVQEVNYITARPFMKVGDIIACGGNGRVSKVIKKFTSLTTKRNEVSHIAVVDQVTRPYFEENTYEIQIIESTTLSNDGKSGVQRRRLSDVVKHYDGDMWFLSLTDIARNNLNIADFFNWLTEQEGKEYDTTGAIKSALDLFEDTILDFIDTNDDDFHKLFCSMLAAGAYKAGGLFRRIAGIKPTPMFYKPASEFTPIDICQLPFFRHTYYQIKGNLKPIME